MRAAALAAAAMFSACAVWAAPPQLAIPDGQVGLPGSRVAPNLLLHWSLTIADAGAAYRDEYSAATEYDGYFNPRLCYSYLGDQGGYFSPLKTADAKRQCGGDSFSGNLLNWASMSRLDLLRLALTGGDRVIDDRGLTVLQRAWLPEAATNFRSRSIDSANTVTPFGAGALYISSCRNRIMFSENPAASCDKPPPGEFNARVKVCDKADSESRPQLCFAYKGGRKPEGAIQENADLMRMGAMGYLTDLAADDENFYGGALRAPLKFVGHPKTGPLRPEWNPVTGMLEEDPDNAGGAKSGLLNFINLSSRRGAYKTSDPGAELFYEGLRYLQGRQASPGSGEVVEDDGLAVWSTRDDPVTETCQRTTAAVVGHSSFVRDRYVPGNTIAYLGDAARAADGFHGTFDVMQATRRIGELEGGELANLDTRKDGPDGAGSYYLAGAAYWAHTNAIRHDSDAPIDTLALELDASPKPLSSALYLTAKYGAFLDRNRDKNPFVTTTGEATDSEWSFDGRTPAGYFSGADPHQIGHAVREMFAAARYPRGEVMGKAAGGGNYLIQASHDRQQSTGTLRRYDISRTRDGKISADGAPAWDAAKLTPAPESRKIYTSVRDSEGGSKTIDFAASRLPALDEGLVNFLRGDRSRETGQAGGNLRRRASVLGDIVHSAPVIVGSPSASVMGAGYAQFHASVSKRRSAVYVGANDGMLHAFDTATGVELFAYVPNALHTHLYKLGQPGYMHRPYVDASPGVGEALAGGKWRTVLASGMGMGARGVFALDVTDPSNFGTGLGALWEFTEKDDAAIGHIRSAPLIAKLRIGMKDLVPEYRYFVAVASGLNNYDQDDGDNAARGALFLLALDKPANEPWKHGFNYYKLVTPLSEPKIANALAPPAFALAPDGSVRFAYAGDLQGNLWRFDFTGKPPWSKAVGPGKEGEPLFVARDDSGNRQPINHAPRVVFAPGAGYLVLVATGRLLENADLDPSGYAMQSFYAIRDSAAKPPVLVAGRRELASRSASGSGPYVINGDAVRFEGSRARKGWYLDFPNWRAEGERTAGTAFLASGALIFDTLAPGASVCASMVTRTYAVDALTGLAYTSGGVSEAGQVTGEVVEQAALLSPPLLFDMGMVAGQRSATGATVATHTVNIVRLRGEGKPPLSQKVTVKTPAGRLSWREVANWQELHEAAKK
ncbi:hypothetical protein HHL21_14250 [Massilia sp. RP-1-19]|uniref:PilY1 beta-propeller domain-containing protein n=1 Tax=Massilia polaris TaxID=2728846 RepID=A0A848HMI9_9BURK|nr:PilC/PilY family type IV pilus protein [Massilia polaris]NML62217.1 hypothetical protein [Massilia polaris]